MSQSIWNEMEFVAKVDVTENGFGPFGIHTTLTTQGCLTCKTFPGHCSAITLVLKYFKKTSIQLCKSKQEIFYSSLDLWAGKVNLIGILELFRRLPFLLLGGSLPTYHCPAKFPASFFVLLFYIYIILLICEHLYANACIFH